MYITGRKLQISFLVHSRNGLRNTIFPRLYINFHGYCKDDIYEIYLIWKGHFSLVFIDIPCLDG